MLMRLLVLVLATVNALPSRTSLSLLAQDAPVPVVDNAAAPVAPVDDSVAGAAAAYEAAAAGTAAAMIDPSCVSIAAGGNDYWCQTTCFNPLSCPATMCQCGGAAASPAPVIAAAGAAAPVAADSTGAVAADYGAAAAAGAPAAVAPDYGAAAATPNIDASCVSISPSANNNWCQLTCVIPASCPVTMCKCGGEQASASPDAVPARR